MAVRQLNLVSPVAIVIPAYGAADRLRDCLESLARYAPPGCPVLVADDATPDDTVEAAARAFEGQLTLTYVRRRSNLGFVENCNEAIRSILPTGADILLLNSDTEVTEGFLEEMSAVLHLHEKHAVVSPRSNNATIFSVPMSRNLKPDDSYRLWLRIRELLPRYQVMPTAVGFCMLIKNVVLRQLGVFDPVYSPGYNEENDLVCRINRHGYSAVAAHRAFVFHHESSTFGARRSMLEQRNYEVLLERYPEYPRKLDRHLRHGIDPIDHFAVLWRDRRPTILFDLFHLPAKHSGTSEFALSLLLHLSPLLERDHEVFLGLSDEAKEFFAPEITGYRFYDPLRHGDERFDLVFKPSQVFTWPELRRMCVMGARVSYTHQDLIAVRCDYLSNPSTQELFKLAAQLADRVVTISEFSKSDFAAFYGLPTAFEVIHQGTHAAAASARRADGHVLIVGNQFHHKAVARAATELASLTNVVAIGGDEPPPAGVRWLASGALSRAAFDSLYQMASVVVYPSFYEGFGLPIVDAMARGIPVVALDNAINRELRDNTGGSDLVLVRDHSDLLPAVSAILRRDVATVANGYRRRGWDDVAVDYARTFRELLSKEIDIDLVRQRWATITTIDSIHPMSSGERELYERLETLSREQQVLKAELDAAYQSRSWRLTSPIRRLLRMIR